MIVLINTEIKIRLNHRKILVLKNISFLDFNLKIFFKTLLISLNSALLLVIFRTSSVDTVSLCARETSGVSDRVRDMGNDPPAGEVPRWFPPPGGTADVGHGTQTSTGWDMGVPTNWGGAGNGGAG